MKVPCKDCAIDAPEKFSSMLQTKSECFKMGWHVHKTKGQFKDTVFEDGEQYIAFMDNELWEKLYENV